MEPYAKRGNSAAPFPKALFLFYRSQFQYTTNMKVEKKIQKILQKLPKSPGIYKMLSKEGKVIYIGKAKDLSKRVKQYFRKNYEHSTRTKKLIEKTEDLQFTAVDSDLEAIILEKTLIKQFLPKYNVIMKDDKSFVYIKITKEDFPRIQIVRKIEKDGAKYIGPKTASHKVTETFKTLKNILPFRHCNLDIKALENNKVKVSRKTIKYPCLDHYIKKCAAPCIANCTKEEYQAIIKNVEEFLSGKAGGVLKNLEQTMKDHAINKKFEKAAKVRDKIEKVKSILEKQKVSDPNQEDKDIINYVITRDRAYFNLFQIRDGKLIGQENFILTAKEIEENSEDPEVLETFLHQYYDLATDIPKEILVPHLVDLPPENIKLTVPQKGTKSRLLTMSLNNARIYADRNKPKWEEDSKDNKDALAELAKILRLKEPINRIECYDISHLSGTDTVGSMIVFEKGIAKNNFYRKFKIKTVDNKPDDYKSMEEVLTRRFLKISDKFKNKDYEFKKALKKDLEEIKNTDETAQYYILKKQKKLIGHIGIIKHTDKIGEIKDLIIDKKERGRKLGYKLIKESINKVKPKRIYGICKEEMLEYYLLAGFEEIKKIPKELEVNFKKRAKKIKKPIWIVYDKLKHKEDESFNKIPDLVIVDGGQGQLGCATKVLNEFKIDIPYISLAKRLEEIYHPKYKKPLNLPENNEALKLLQRARDEAHRFAISYNRQLRSKKFS